LQMICHCFDKITNLKVCHKLLLLFYQNIYENIRFYQHLTKLVLNF